LQIAFCFNQVLYSSQGHVILHSRPMVRPWWLEGMVGSISYIDCGSQSLRQHG